MNATEVAIYGLHDPRTGECRYVGKSVDPDARLIQHLQPSQLRARTYKNNWIKGLLAEDLTPELRVIDVFPAAQANDAERRIIAMCRTLGAPLTNGTDGGDGGAITDPDALARVRQAHLGTKATDETRALMSAAHRARYADPAERERQREIALALGLTPPRMVGVDNPFALLTDETVTALRVALKQGTRLQDAAKDLGVSKSTAWTAATGRTWSHVAEEPVRSKPRRRLSDEDVNEIRRMVSEGSTQTSVAVLFGVHQTHVSNIVRGERHASASQEEIL